MAQIVVIFIPPPRSGGEGGELGGAFAGPSEPGGGLFASN
jgi:hypothetical protein